MKQIVTNFEEVVRMNQRLIYNLAYRYLGNHYDADEAMQKTFLKAYEKLESFRGESSLKTWIYRIAVNICKNYIRDRKDHQDIDNPAFQIKGKDNQLAGAIDKEERLMLFEKLKKFPEKQMDVIILRIYDDHSFSEIAEILGIKENAAKVDFHIGMKKLKNELGKNKE